MDIYDTIIIGAGPAGLTASIYAACYKLKQLVISQTIGGSMALAPDIVNYPGFVETTGKELTEKMYTQAKMRGGSFLEDLVVGLSQENHISTITTKNGSQFQTRSVILATGTERKKLNVPGELEYASKGVYYCVTCEKQDYENQDVIVVGSGNSAAQGALQLAQAASHVFVFCRGTALHCDPILSENMQKHPTIEIMTNTSITEIKGDGQVVQSVKITSQGQEKELPIHKIFVEIGGVPGTHLVAPLGIAVDEKQFIKVDDALSTSLPGIFAAGDLVSSAFAVEQISTAVGLGARAASAAFAFVKGGKAPQAWGKALIQKPS